MISSEQDATSNSENHDTALDGSPGAQVILGAQVYDTIMQAAPTGTPGEVTGLLLGDRVRMQGDTQKIVVKRAVKLNLAYDGTGFLLDQEAIEKIADVTAASEPAHVLGWFYADPGLIAFPQRVSISRVQALMPAGSNLFALVNPTTNTGVFYLWDGAHYHQAAIEQDTGARSAWASEPTGAIQALGSLLAGKPATPPDVAPVPVHVDPVAQTPDLPQPERVTAPIPIGTQAQATRTDDTAPLPAFLKRKYNLEALRLKSTWPEWTRQVRATPGNAVSALRHNTAVLFTSRFGRRAAFIALGALLSITVGATLVFAGLNSASPPTQYNATPTPTAAIPISAVEPSPSATQLEVAIPTATPSATPIVEIVADTATPTPQPTPATADTETPIPTRRPPAPTSTPLPEPPPPPTIEVESTGTPEPTASPTEAVEQPTPTAEPSPSPTDTPVVPPAPTQRPTPLPGILTPTPKLPTITPLPGILTPAPIAGSLTPTPTPES